MNIYTSYFGKLKAIEKAGILPVSIAVSPPKWYMGPQYRALAPRYDMLRMDSETYLIHFNAILNGLSAEKVLKDLKHISDMNGGKDIALLCFEKPSDLCHRQYVAKWLLQEEERKTEEFQAPETKTAAPSAARLF